MGTAVDAGVGVGAEVGTGVDVGAIVGAGVGVGVGVGKRAGVGAGVTVGVGLGLGIGCRVAAGLGSDVGAVVLTGDSIPVIVGDGPTTSCPAQAIRKSPATANVQPEIRFKDTLQPRS